MFYGKIGSCKLGSSDCNCRSLAGLCFVKLHSSVMSLQCDPRRKTHTMPRNTFGYIIPGKYFESTEKKYHILVAPEVYIIF